MSGSIFKSEVIFKRLLISKKPRTDGSSVTPAVLNSSEHIERITLKATITVHTVKSERADDCTAYIMPLFIFEQILSDTPLFFPKNIAAVMHAATFDKYTIIPASALEKMPNPIIVTANDGEMQ